MKYLPGTMLRHRMIKVRVVFIVGYKEQQTMGDVRYKKMEPNSFYDVLSMSEANPDFYNLYNPDSIEIQRLFTKDYIEREYIELV